MVYGLYLSADGLATQQYRQSVITNNLANVNTAGFKPDRVAFAERLNESAIRRAAATRHPLLDGATGGLTGLPVYTDFSPGSIIPTGNPLDLAILEDGFLTI
ncbi:MAG: flagellar hook-basal body complex protein, partial [Phycisphaerae bacterium]